MSESIVMVVDKLCEKFGVVVDWTSENVVPYVLDLMDRVVKYEIVTSVIPIVFLLVITIVIGVLYAHYNKLYKTFGTHDEVSIAFFLAFIVCVVIFVFALILHTCAIAKCIFVPEKVFIEMLNNYL